MNILKWKERKGGKEAESEVKDREGGVRERDEESMRERDRWGDRVDERKRETDKERERETRRV